MKTHKGVVILTLVFGLALPLVLFAAQDSKTSDWEKAFVAIMRDNLCGPNGKMVEQFSIASDACKTTYDYSAKHCLKAAHQLPFYAAYDKTTGQIWGLFLGTCIGVAYDMKHNTTQRTIP